MRHLLFYIATAVFAFFLGAVANIPRSPQLQALKEKVYPGSLKVDCPKTSSPAKSDHYLTLPSLPTSSALSSDKTTGETIIPDPIEVDLSRTAKSMIRQFASQVETIRKEQLNSGVEEKIKQIELVTKMTVEQRQLITEYYYAENLREVLSHYFALSAEDIFPGIKTPQDILGENISEALAEEESQRWAQSREYEQEQMAAFIEEQAGLSPTQRQTLEQILKDSNSEELAVNTYYRRELQLTNAQYKVLTEATEKVDGTELTTDLIQLYQPGLPEDSIPAKFFHYYEDPDKRTFSDRRMRSHIIDRELIPYLNVEQQKKLAAIREREDAVDLEQYQD